MRYCPLCNGELEEIDRCGTEECQICGTTYSIMPMERNDEPKQWSCKDCKEQHWEHWQDPCQRTHRLQERRRVKEKER